MPGMGEPTNDPFGVFDPPDRMSTAEPMREMANATIDPFAVNRKPDVPWHQITEIEILVAIVAFTAFCIWLGVRMMNRRERWAKWAAIALVALLAYPLSFWPALWISSRQHVGVPVLHAYVPLSATARYLPESTRSNLGRFLVFAIPRDCNLIWGRDKIMVVH
jgi:hypothetical protein